MLTIMEVDECEHVNEEKAPPTKKLAAVWMIASLSDYHILGCLRAHKDTASQLTEDASLMPFFAN